jgi:hypothetical protein
MFYEVISKCPYHGKPVYIRVKAQGQLNAKNKVLGMTVPCPWGPLDSQEHSFEIKKILGVTVLPWMPSTIVSSAPGFTPVSTLDLGPLETVYYMDGAFADRQMSRARWWER